MGERVRRMLKMSGWGGGTKDPGSGSSPTSAKGEDPSGVVEKKRKKRAQILLGSE